MKAGESEVSCDTSNMKYLQKNQNIWSLKFENNLCIYVIYL